MARKQYDWEAIEKEYRAGKLSIRAIADQFGCNEKSIRKKAIQFGWERDLSAKVAEKVRNDLVRNEVRTSDHLDEKGIVEQAAATQIQVIREHRTSITGARNLIAKLYAELEAQTDGTDLIETLKLALEQNDIASYGRIVDRLTSLPTRIKGFNDLANALKTLIGLERQSFGITDNSIAEDNTVEEIVRRIVKRG